MREVSSYFPAGYLFKLIIIYQGAKEKEKEKEEKCIPLRKHMNAYPAHRRTGEDRIGHGPRVIRPGSSRG